MADLTIPDYAALATELTAALPSRPAASDAAMTSASERQQELLTAIGALRDELARQRANLDPELLAETLEEIDDRHEDEQ